MATRNVVHAVRIRWYIPLIAVAVALAAQEIWESYHGPTRYISVAPVEIDLSLGRSSGSSSTDRAHRFRDVVADDEPIETLLDGLARASSPEFEEILDLAARAEVERPTRLGAAFADVDSAQDPQKLFEELRRSVALRRRGARTLDVEAQCKTAAQAQWFAWLTAETLRRRLNRDLRDVLVADRERLGARRKLLEEKWKRAIAAQLELSQRLGVVDVGERESFLKRLIAELDEESSRLEIEQLELARRIDASRKRRSASIPMPADGADSNAGPPEKIEEGAEKVRQELLDARLEYEVQAAVLSKSHPRLIELEQRISDLDRRWTEAEQRSGAVDGERSAAADAERIDAYRSLSMRIDTLHKRRRTLLDELTEIQGLRPEILAIERRETIARNRLQPVSESLTDLESFLARDSLVVGARLPSEPARTNLAGVGPAWKLVALLLGLAIGILGAVSLASIDRRLRGEETGRYLGLPVLAKVPTLGRKYRYDPEAMSDKGERLAPASVRESFTAIATVARKVGQELGMKSFAVASANAGEGKSTTAIHLACALARKGLCVALVDGDLQHPALHRYLSLPNEVGLTSLVQEEYLQRQVIEDGVPVDEVIELDPADSASVEAVLEWALLDNLFVMTSGPPMVNPEVAVNSQAMQSALATLSDLVDYVVIDAPAIKEEGEALELIGLADCCVLVVGAGQCDRGDAVRTKQLIENVETSVLGVVVNRYSGEPAAIDEQPTARERSAVTVAST